MDVLRYEKQMITIGSKVKMSEELKAILLGTCNHPIEENPVDCYACSTDHCREFCDCVGEVIGFTDLNNCKPGHPNYDLNKIDPELVDVRWEPGLRYAYFLNQLVEVVE